MENFTSTHFPGGDAPRLVRFYADDAAMMAEVADLVAKTLAARGTSIVIATPGHCTGIRALLASPSGVLFADAGDTLSQMLVDGWPDEPPFRAVVEPLLAEAGICSGPVNVFVEIAALLCAQGRYQAAVRLEQLWESLCADHRLGLYCAYPWRLFSDASQAQVFEDICAAHGRAYGSTLQGADLDLTGRSLTQAHREQMATAPGSELREHRKVSQAGDPAGGLHHLGPDGTILWADRVELRMLGYRWEEYVGRHIANFHVDVEMVDLILDTLLSGGVLADQPARLRRKDGSIRHVRMCSSSVFEEGRLTYSVCTTREEAGRNERAADLTRRERQLLKAPVAVAFLMAPELRFRLANRHFCDLFGQRELVGKRLVEALPQLRYGAVEAALECVFETGHAWSHEEFGMVLVDARGMPAERFFKIDLEAVYTAAGERHGVMAVVVDVTGHVRTRRASRMQAPPGKSVHRQPGHELVGPDRRSLKRADYNTRFRTNRRST